MPKIKKKWAQKAVNPRNRGLLRAYVAHRYGHYGFTQRGTIKIPILKELVHEGNAIQPYNHRAQFALNINKNSRHR